MEHRVQNLEEFQKKWKFYFWAITILATLTAVFFGVRISDLNGSISNLSNEVATKENRIIELEEKLQKADSVLDHTLMKAGNLSDIINETKKASLEARDASVKADSSSKTASKDANKAFNAATKAEAIAKTVDSRLYKFEKILTKIKAQIETQEIKELPDQTSNKQDMKQFQVQIMGSNVEIIFEEGANLYKEIELTQSNYSGIIYVPVGHIAIVKGMSSNGDFTITKKLKGRVVDQLMGSNNDWIQE
jgi:hypothetical protein